MDAAMTQTPSKGYGAIEGSIEGNESHTTFSTNVDDEPPKRSRRGPIFATVGAALCVGAAVVHSTSSPSVSAEGGLVASLVASGDHPIPAIPESESRASMRNTGHPESPPKSGQAASVFSGSDYTKVAPTQQTGGPSWPDFGASEEDSVNIVVDTTTETRKMSQYFLGSNLPSYLTSDFVTATEPHLASTGTSFLRFPGGSPADKYLHDGNYTRFPYFEQWDWMTGAAKYSLADFATTIKNTGATPLVQLNFALCVVYGTDACAAYAVEFHEELMNQGVNVTFYEFGNENYGSWEVPYDDYPVTATYYGEALSVVSELMRASWPHLRFGAVVVDDLVVCDVNETIITNWTHDLLVATEEAGAVVDFMVMHNYFQANFGSSAPVSYETLFNGTKTMKAMAADVKTIFSGARPADVVPPVIVDEFSLAELSSPACGATLQFTSALWHANVLGDTISDEDETISSLMPFAWADKAKNCTKDAAGPVGDYGMLSMKDPRESIADGTPRSHYYAYSLFNLAFGEAAVSTTMTGGSSDASASASSECGSSLHAYGSVFNAGETGLYMVNTGVVTCSVTLSTGGTGSMAANGWVLRGDGHDDPTATGVEWNGNVGSASASLNNPVDENYERYLLSAEDDGSFVFEVPPYSVSGVVVYNEDSAGTIVSGVDGWSTDDKTPGGTTTHHDHDESCGKGCTEAVVDDDTLHSGDPTTVR